MTHKSDDAENCPPCPPLLTEESQTYMRLALLRLANAADDVGVRLFDTDTMSAEVEELQAATQEARRLLATTHETRSDAGANRP